MGSSYFFDGKDFVQLLSGGKGVRWWFLTLQGLNFTSGYPAASLSLSSEIASKCAAWSLSPYKL